MSPYFRKSINEKRQNSVATARFKVMDPRKRDSFSVFSESSGHTKVS
jgi:hypothetical protein